MNYSPTTAQPAGGESSGLQFRKNERATEISVPRAACAVKPQSGLLAQALAAEQRAQASAAWHRERAASYLRWFDLSWAAAQFDQHIAAAEFQEAVAERHRQIAAALGGGQA